MEKQNSCSDRTLSPDTAVVHHASNVSLRAGTVSATVRLYAQIQCFTITRHNREVPSNVEGISCAEAFAPALQAAAPPADAGACCPGRGVTSSWSVSRGADMNIHPGGLAAMAASAFVPQGLRRALGDRGDCAAGHGDRGARQQPPHRQLILLHVRRRRLTPFERSSRERRRRDYPRLLLSLLLRQLPPRTQLQRNSPSMEPWPRDCSE